MNLRKSRCLQFVIVLTLTVLFAVAINAQDKPVVLTGVELSRVVPAGFYFEGQSAPTQMRNAAAARLGQNRLVVASLVDTSGYSSEIRAKYEGFLITDSDIQIGGEELETGAYGFGYTNDGKFNIFDISGKRVLTVDAGSNRDLRRPRPLMMVVHSDGRLRLYAGRSYVVISAR